MACFRFPKWVIERIDRTRRVFLWGKNESAKNPISLINWTAVCLPKEFGGLGIADLEIRNISLMIRWWWRLQADPNSLWAVVATRLRWIGNYANGPGLWALTGSFFWRQLIKVHCIFQLSTYWVVGNGMSISYWYDAWAGQAKARLGLGQPWPAQPQLSLSDAKDINFLIDPEDTELQNIVLTNRDDLMRWKWGNTGTYSASSLYKAMVGIGKTRWPFMIVWKSRVPPTIKVFITMMLRDKILTHDVMNRRGMHCNLACMMCANCPIESTLHLLFLCPYATHVWFLVSNLVGSVLMRSDLTTQLTWFRSQEMKGKLETHKWVTYYMCTVWNIWKQRNQLIFGGSRKDPSLLADIIYNEAVMWLNNC